MTTSKSRNWIALAACATLLAFAGTAAAGPPLVCHPLDAGNAALLPWSPGSDWHSPHRSYDVTRLSGDTLRLLTPEAPMLARMENLRRAAVYATQSPVVARELFAALVDRAAEGPRNRLAWFDAAYLIETYRQLEHAQISKALPKMAAPATAYRELNALDGYAMLGVLLAREGASAEIEFARSMMSSEGTQARLHWRQATSLAAKDPLLSKNLAKYGY